MLIVNQLTILAFYAFLCVRASILTGNQILHTREAFHPETIRPETQERVDGLKASDPNYMKKLPILEQSKSGRFYERKSKTTKGLKGLFNKATAFVKGEDPNDPRGRRKLADGEKAYVRSGSGRVRVTEAGRGAHGYLAGLGPVRYAGEARFDKGHLSNWDNNSGTYQVPASVRGPPEFPVDKFRGYRFRR
jgi:hypothetical protein